MFNNWLGLVGLIINMKWYFCNIEFRQSFQAQAQHLE